MTELQGAGLIPEFDLADRMRKALREAGVSAQEMADYLGVRRETVSTWINGRNRPDTRTLRLWAMACNVDFGWLAGEQGPKWRGGLPTAGREIRKPGRLSPLHGLAAVAGAGFAAASALAGTAALTQPFTISLR